MMATESKFCDECGRTVPVTGHYFGGDSRGHQLETWELACKHQIIRRVR